MNWTLNNVNFSLHESQHFLLQTQLLIPQLVSYTPISFRVLVSHSHLNPLSQKCHVTSSLVKLVLKAICVFFLHSTNTFLWLICINSTHSIKIKKKITHFTEILKTHQFSSILFQIIDYDWTYKLYEFYSIFFSKVGIYGNSSESNLRSSKFH